MRAILAALIAGLGGAGFIFWQGEPLAPEVADLQARVSVIEERLDARVIGEHKTAGLSFTGTGFAVSEPFDLVAGSLFAEIEAPSKLVKVAFAPALGSDIARDMTVFQGNWPHAGTSAHIVDTAGTYVLAVEAIGEWSVVIEQ